MKQLLWASLFALFLGACGGGGGGSTYTPPSLIKIDEQNADAAVVTSLESMGIRGIGDIILPTGASYSSAKNIPMVAKFAKTVTTSSPSYVVESIDPVCPFGGSYTVSSDGSTVVFYECGVEENVTIDGTIKAINDTTLEFIDLTVIDLNDDITTYFSSATISAPSETEFSATISGYATDGMNRVDYERYTVTASNITELGAIYTFNGYIKTDCLGGWIQIKTIQAIPIPNSDECPTQGEISVIGESSEVNVKINENESITITLNGEPHKVYETCNDIPSLDDVCPLQPL
ncbi:MAG TPA: hypothetical protein VIN02_08150 [Sulfurovum sp.]